MDMLLSAALQEIAVEGAAGCSLPRLWASLQGAAIGADMLANRRLKQLLWQELINVPGMLLVLPHALAVPTTDRTVQSVDEAEKLELHLVAPETLIDSSLGMYDLKVCDARLSKEQRNVLECIAKSRSKGITQSQLAKEFKTPGNKIFYLVKMLEVRGLVVRQATLVRTLDGNGEGKHVPIVATNLLHLTRYAKDLTLSSHQRFEIFNPSKSAVRDESNSFREDLDEETEGTASKEREFIIKDDLPAMQAVCQKLEETEGKVLVVSDLKTSLGYRMAVGHRTWRRLVKRLQDAGLVEILSAQIEHKVRSCIRLVKSFDARAFKTTNEETETVLPLKSAKRGQVTDMVTELPIDQQIYDLVDRSGSEGVHMIEVFNCLGLQNKRNYYRISTLLERHLLVSEAENHKRSTLYRLKTAKNANGSRQALACGEEPGAATYEATVPPSNSGLNEECEEVAPPQISGLNEDYGSLSPDKDVSLSVAQRKAKGSARKALQQARMLKGKSKQMHLTQDGIEIVTEYQHEKDEKNLAPSVMESNAIVPVSDFNLSVYSPQADFEVLPIAISQCPPQFTGNESHVHLKSSMSVTRAQREKRILEKLQAETFVLRVELHKWLEEVENRKNTMMDRKTLSRILQGLQTGGHCKCIMLSMPGLTNCGRQRTTEVVLLPSLVVDPELLSKVHDQVRKFDMVSRGHGLSRVKARESVPILTGVPRMHAAHVKRITKFDNQSESGRSMQVNGFIPAKMVRVRMLHYFLWGYVNSLPEEIKLLPGRSGTSGEMVGSCKIFGLANAVQTMPLELFLQTIGSFHRIENIAEGCKQGLRLCDLPKEDFALLLDSNATGRLSWLVDVLRRLKLVRLVMGCGPAVQVDQEELGKSSLAAVLTYAMEREPYLEEPAPHPLPSMNLDTYDLSPRARHEFSIVNKDGLDAYWQNLEYFYSGAQPVVARRAFPGSNVPELFGLRSWASLKIMSVEQRTELLKRVGDGGIEKRKPWHECVVIAKELNLSLQQVLRVSYEKNRVYRLQTLQKAGQISKKRASGDLGEPPHVKAYKKQRRQDDVVDKGVVFDNQQPHQSVNEKGKQQAHQDEDDGDDDEETEGFGIGGQPMYDFSFVASVKPSRVRSRRFTWSERLDRNLIVAYARQRAQLGALYPRVNWDLMADLPAPPQACRRRMAQLRRDLGVRKAVTSLCSLLALRYINHAHTRTNNGLQGASLADIQVLGSEFEGTSSERKQGTHTVGHLNAQQALLEGPTSGNFGQEYKWDDMREPFVAAALDEVMRCRAAVKASSSTRSGACRIKLAKGPYPAASISKSESTPMADNTGRTCMADSCAPGAGKVVMNLEAVSEAGARFSKLTVLSRLTVDSVGHVKGADALDVTIHDEETMYRSSGQMSGRSLTAAGPTRRVRKAVPSTLRGSIGIQEMSNEQHVRKSMAVANAVELIKLILLNSAEDTQLSGILVEAVQRFKEVDVFTAVKYLKERGFLVAGQPGQAFVLSPKFFHDCSSSRFPVGIGDDCLSTEKWFVAHMKDIDNGWVSLPPEQQSGELLHLLALVSTDEFSLTPFLPADDLGEMMDEKEKGKRKVFLNDYVRNVKARTLSSSIPHWPTLRRERGFPGIEVSIVRSSGSLAMILDTFAGAQDTSELACPNSCSVERPMDPVENSDNVAAIGLLQRLNHDSRVIASARSLLVRESVLAERKAVLDVSCGEHDSESNSRSDLVTPPGLVSRTQYSPIIKSILGDCIAHWCLGSWNTSATVEMLQPCLLETIYCLVEEAGEEGLSLEELAGCLQTKGTAVDYEVEGIDLYVQALQSFDLVNRVNAYDHVRIVEMSRSKRFFLHLSHKGSWEAENKLCSGEHIRDGGKQISLSSLTIRADTPGGYSGASETTTVRNLRTDPRTDENLAGIASPLLTENSTSSMVIAKGGEHRIIPLRPDEDADRNSEYITIIPWLNQNGTVKKSMLKGLTRRVLGIVTLHPGISEATLQEQLNVLNPQSVRQLTEILELDGLLVVRLFPEPSVAVPPRLLQDLMVRETFFSKPSLSRHYFVNPLAGQNL